MAKANTQMAKRTDSPQKKARATAQKRQPPASRRASPSRAPQPQALPAEVIAVLLEVAANMRDFAYAPYSGYRVGAALLASSGNVYGGCNVENASYGLSICAERAAVAKAVSEGDAEVVAIAVVTEDGGTPCGACRQVLIEFGDAISVIIADAQGKYTLATSGQLLPLAFQLR